MRTVVCYVEALQYKLGQKERGIDILGVIQARAWITPGKGRAKRFTSKQNVLKRQTKLPTTPWITVK